MRDSFEIKCLLSDKDRCERFISDIGYIKDVINDYVLSPNPAQNAGTFVKCSFLLDCIRIFLELRAGDIDRQVEEINNELSE